jgi:hypothetical protein
MSAVFLSSSYSVLFLLAIAFATPDGLCCTFCKVSVIWELFLRDDDDDVPANEALGMGKTITSQLASRASSARLIAFSIVALE